MLPADIDRTELLRKMLLIREFEENVKDLFADGEIPGFVHLYIGEESVAVGACTALEEGDYITSTHRGHGHTLAMGLDPNRALAELFGKKTGYCGGKGGSMHVADLEEGMLGAQPIVGASVPLATGAALSAQYHRRDTIGLAFTGDGATAQGQVHESINLAATWDLPVVYVIENNLYSEAMPFEKQHNIEDLADMSASYGIPGVTVDGQDVEAVYDAVADARERALAGDGPTLIEAKTYRYRGHYEGDPEHYRDREEVEWWRENRDPIENYRKKLQEAGELTTAEIEEIESAVIRTVQEAIDHAREADLPDPEDAYEDVFAEPVPETEYHRDRMQADRSPPLSARGESG